MKELNRLSSFRTSADRINIYTNIFGNILVRICFPSFLLLSGRRKNLIVLIWPFAEVNGRENSFFGLFTKVYVREMIKFCDFLNLRNFMVAKVYDLQVVQECFKL